MKTYKILSLSILIFLISTGNVFSKNYFVKSDGNDQLDGQSDASAWETIEKINSFKFATGDDVFFKCDDSWTGSWINVDWSGTSENKVMLGAYYGSGTIGVSGNKPIIDGNNTVPNNQYLGLIHISGQSHVTIKNLNLINSYGQGIRYMNGSTYGVVQNVDISNTGSAGINFQGSTTQYGLIEGCTVTLAGTRQQLGLGSKEWPDWPLAVGSNYADNITVRKCKIYNTYSEGIGFYKEADNCVAEYNLVYNTCSASIYTDGGQYNTIRYNMVYGTTDPVYRVRSINGIKVGDEALVAVRSRNNEIYGNFVANCSSGLTIGGQSGAVFLDSHVYNNTFVGNNSGIAVSGVVTFSNSAIKNNIIWQAGGTSLFSGRTTTPGLTWDYNNWSDPVKEEVKGSNDVIGAPPLKKTMTWRYLTAESLSISDFNLEAPFTTKAANLGDKYIKMIDAASSNFPSNIVIKDQNSDGSGWVFGADIFIENVGSSETQKPTAPMNLKIGQ